MRLADLEPTFVKHTSDESFTRLLGVSFADASGVLFVCPTCKAEQSHSVLVWFRDRGVPDAMTPGPGRWVASGTCLDDLTLQPSIAIRCWHGWIKNGEVT